MGRLYSEGTRQPAWRKQQRGHALEDIGGRNVQSEVDGEQPVSR